MPKLYLTVKEKLEILAEAYSVPRNLKPTARKYNVLPSSIRKWKKKEEVLQETCVNRSRVKTVNSGPKPENPEIEEAVFNYILDLRGRDIGKKN